MTGDTKYATYSLLVVDDHRTMLQIVQGLLRQIGFVNIDPAMDGLQALAHMEKKRYDLIISDWNMPNMDGLEFLKRVRSSPNNQVKAVPFIMVTAETKSQNIVAAK
jgi:two-component system chemotaxis response regulator CheY